MSRSATGSRGKLLGPVGAHPKRDELEKYSTRIGQMRPGGGSTGVESQDPTLLGDVVEVVWDVDGLDADHLLQGHQAALVVDARPRPGRRGQGAEDAGHLTAHRIDQGELVVEVEV